ESAQKGWLLDIPRALERITEKRQHAAEENDANPEKQRSARDHFGKERSVSVRLERRNPICHAGHVEQQNVPPGQDEEKYLKTKRRVVNVLKRLADDEHGTSHQIDQKSKHSPSYQCVHTGHRRRFPPAQHSHVQCADAPEQN